MATRRVTTTDDGASERIVEREVIESPRSGGLGIGAVIVAFAVLAIVAMIAFFLADMNRSDAMRTNAVTSAASTMSQSADSAAKDVGNAAQNVGNAANSAAGAVNPAPPDTAPAPPAPSDSPPR